MKIDVYIYICIYLYVFTLKNIYIILSYFLCSGIEFSACPEGGRGGPGYAAETERATESI